MEKDILKAAFRLAVVPWGKLTWRCIYSTYAFCWVWTYIQGCLAYRQRYLREKGWVQQLSWWKKKSGGREERGSEESGREIVVQAKWLQLMTSATASLSLEWYDLRRYKFIKLSAKKAARLSSAALAVNTDKSSGEGTETSSQSHNYWACIHLSCFQMNMYDTANLSSLQGDAVIWLSLWKWWLYSTPPAHSEVLSDTKGYFSAC